MPASLQLAVAVDAKLRTYQYYSSVLASSIMFRQSPYGCTTRNHKDKTRMTEDKTRMTEDKMQAKAMIINFNIMRGKLQFQILVTFYDEYKIKA